ncbi:MAG: GYD domain-containing protein [Vicinamibacterales bacterium]
MERYLITAKYTSVAAAAVQAEGHTNRESAGRGLAESLGGQVVTWMWLDGTEWDFAVLFDLPDYGAVRRMGALSAASGAFERTRVCRVSDSAEMDAASSLGGSWRPPGASPT